MSFENFKQEDNRVAFNMDARNDNEYIFKNEVFDTIMDALSQCHNLFEAEEKNLSEQGKQVWQTVIAAILKANHKT